MPEAQGRKARKAPGASAQHTPEFSPRRVLVVDDNRDSAEGLAMLLRTSEHVVQVALDGPAALEAAAAFRPEVVLLDLGMPGMDGFEVARRMRQRPEMDKTLSEHACGRTPCTSPWPPSHESMFSSAGTSSTSST